MISMKIINVVGTRPNFMKIAPILRQMRKYTAAFRPILIHTGQHYDYKMSKVFFKDLELPEPDIYLGVGSGTHAEQTGKVMIEFEKVLIRERPDLVVVVGDVNSTLAAALAAVKLHIPVAHVEAGLRSRDRGMPEEINRVLTDAIADYLFTPSLDAHENLRREGIPKERIFFVGNVMVDTLLYSKEKARKSDILARLGLTTNRGVLRAADYALLTLHRPHNVDNQKNLKKILDALSEIQKKIKIVFPIHPRTRRRLREFGLQSFLSNSGQWNPTIQSINWETNSVIITPPLAYSDFLKLEMKARFIMTDSGGIQEEATILGVPCLTLRETTERPVTVTQGTNVVVGNDGNNIVKEALKILEGKRKRGKHPQFWDGRAAERIVKILREQSK
jgi:UDP-N-acetylglucosamine 2-epimerase (non-hydrolysing)